MINQKKTANAIGGKTARACESCLKRRAIWFCAVDDAFLCGACDSLVHSANELSSRHKRVCLDTNPTAKPPPPTPSWHQGFTKKARTPRNKAKDKAIKCYNSSQMPVVPEVGNEDDGLLIEENNNHESDRIVFSVPNLEDYHFQNSQGENFKGGFEENKDIISIADTEFNISLIGFDGDNNGWDVNYLPVGFPDNKLAEFAADVESLLERDEGEVAMEGEEKKDDIVHHVFYAGVKVEEEKDNISTTANEHCCYFDWSIDVENDMFNNFDLNFNSNNDCWENDQSQVSCVEENNSKMVVPKEEEDELNTHSMQTTNKEKRITLRLNYEGVINAWASQSCTSPWITGRRPEFDLDHHGWLNSMDNFGQGDVCPTGIDRQGEEWMGYRGHVNGGDGGRRARVSRYREKRRTRLFSKKIRYEVRKLNAEKRPRLKGRFVKRTSLSQVVGKDVGVESSFSYLNG